MLSQLPSSSNLDCNWNVSCSTSYCSGLIVSHSSYVGNLIPVLQYWEIGPLWSNLVMGCCSFEEINVVTIRLSLLQKQIHSSLALCALLPFHLCQGIMYHEALHKMQYPWSWTYQSLGLGLHLTYMVFLLCIWIKIYFAKLKKLYSICTLYREYFYAILGKSRVLGTNVNQWLAQLGV